jgi:hypothetical protein
VSNHPKHTVYHSAVLDAGPDEVWAVVRDIVALVKIIFGDGVKDVHWLGRSSVDHVPATFEFTLLPGGDVATEEVAGRDEVSRSLTYRSIGQVLSIYDYVATYRVLPVTNDHGRSFIEWSREFKVTDDADPGFLPMLLQMIEQEIDTVQAHFAG